MLPRIVEKSIEMQSINNNLQKYYRFVSNLGLGIVCLTGFLYQTFLLLEDFISGKTVVTLKIERLRNESLPAITLCFENFASFEKLAKNDHQLNELYINYTKILEEFNARADNKTDPDQETKIELERIYYRATPELDYSKIPPYHILTNYSIPVDG